MSDDYASPASYFPEPKNEVQRLIFTELEREHATRVRRAELQPRRARRVTGPSIVYSIRLDPHEVALIDARAEEMGIKSSALARNLIRAGLASRFNPEVSDAVDRLEQAVAELRSLVP